MNVIEPGRIVDIKQDDGSVNSAIVSSVNDAARTVTVEWYKGGKIKSKKMELNALMQLNKIEPPDEVPASLPPPVIELVQPKPAEPAMKITFKPKQQQRISPEGNSNRKKIAVMIRDFQSTINFWPLFEGATTEHQITVCVRKRPLNRKEIARKELDIVCVPSKGSVIVLEPKTKVNMSKYLEDHKFHFDYAFDAYCDNEIVYKYTVKPLVRALFTGSKATCFAYGQTGSGKTHTMGGNFHGKFQDCCNGIYAMATRDVFNCSQDPQHLHLKLKITASFFEIYCEKVFDLLADKKLLRVLEDGRQQVQVVGLTEQEVSSAEQVMAIIEHANKTRTSGQTSANPSSSRSHAVFQLTLWTKESSKLYSRISIIDLAGNERGADNCSENRQTRIEGGEINRSLLALKECIRALGRQSTHLPFRDSKLTQVLRDSFIGANSKTCMIAMISPGLNSCDHTLNTLRYANRVKELVATDATRLAPNGDFEPTTRSQLLRRQHTTVSKLRQSDGKIGRPSSDSNRIFRRSVPGSAISRSSSVSTTRSSPGNSLPNLRRVKF